MQEINIPKPPTVNEIFESFSWFGVPEFSELHPALQFALHHADEALLGLLCYWFVRFWVISASRWLGLYCPSHYCSWPRLPWRCAHTYLWRIPVKCYEKLFLIGKRGHTGGFASLLETLSLLYKPGMIHFGRASFAGIWKLLTPIGIKAKTHFFIISSSGGGKTSNLITLISEWRNSVFLIDPDGPVTNTLRDYDARHWVVIDPFGLTGKETDGFNVFDCLIKARDFEGGMDEVDVADRIAHALVITAPDAKQPYFTDAARALLKAILLHVFSSYDASYWNLLTVRRLAVEGIRYFEDEDGQTQEVPEDERMDLLLYSMSQNDQYTAIQGGVATVKLAANETSGSIYSTLSNALDWIDKPALEKVLTKTTLPLEELKTRDDCVFSFLAPVQSIRHELAPFARLLTNTLYDSFATSKQKGSNCLALVDELPSQGRNSTILSILATGRKHKLLFGGIAQNIGQMQEIFKGDWQTFLSEVDFVMWMATGHKPSSEYLATYLGKQTRKHKQGRSKNYRTVDVMDADQVRRYLDTETGNMIVTRPGGRPLKLSTDPYFKALPVWKYEADPDYGDTFPRNLTRKLFGRKRQKST